MADGGKGSAPRKQQDHASYAANWEAIFGKKKPEAQRCKKCGGEMKPSQALAQTFTGVPDFPGDTHPVTLSPGGPGALVDCMKCTACGWSVTTKEQ